MDRKRFLESKGEEDMSLLCAGVSAYSRQIRWESTGKKFYDQNNNRNKENRSSSTLPIPQKKIAPVVESTDKCICQRKIALVFCKHCGFYTNGRVAKVCHEHQNVMFLMDFKICPGCRATDLSECNLTQ